MAELLDVWQVARILKIARRTVYRLIARGDLPEGVKIGHGRRWEPEEIQKAVLKLKKPA